MATIFSLATSAHTKGGQTKFSNLFTMSKKFFLTNGGHGRFGQGVNTPLPVMPPTFWDGVSLNIHMNYHKKISFSKVTRGN